MLYELITDEWKSNQPHKNNPSLLPLAETFLVRKGLRDGIKANVGKTPQKQEEVP